MRLRGCRGRSWTTPLAAGIAGAGAAARFAGALFAGAAAGLAWRAGTEQVAMISRMSSMVKLYFPNQWDGISRLRAFLRSQEGLMSAPMMAAASSGV